MSAAPPTLPADTSASRIHQDRDQLANARVAEADAPGHNYNRSKPRKLLAIQQGGVIGIASESKGRDNFLEASQSLFGEIDHIGHRCRQRPVQLALGLWARAGDGGGAGPGQPPAVLGMRWQPGSPPQQPRDC
jgi:hypothetical protein